MSDNQMKWYLASTARRGLKARPDQTGAMILSLKAMQAILSQDENPEGDFDFNSEDVTRSLSQTFNMDITGDAKLRMAIVLAASVIMQVDDAGRSHKKPALASDEFYKNMTDRLDTIRVRAFARLGAEGEEDVFIEAARVQGELKKMKDKYGIGAVSVSNGPFSRPMAA